MRFSTSRRLASSIQFPLVGQITLLFRQFIFIRFAALRVRQAPCSHRPRVHEMPNFSISFEIEIASSSPSKPFPPPLSCVLPPAAAALLLLFHSAAAALILLTCLLLGALLALHCNCCQTYHYRMSDFAHEHASSISTARWFSSASWTLRGTLSSSRPSHVPPRARLMPRRACSCHVFQFVPFVTDTHCYLPSKSPDSLVNFAPGPSLRQMVRHFLLSWYPLHLCCS